tara:strand:+ start:3970 stop:4449 length:480 start_codon:yes stop_codon:yes gene_type:complete
MSDECHELKTIKYKSMLLNNNAEEKEETVENLSNMENFLEEEKQMNNNEPWTKLNKTNKIIKFTEFVEKYSVDNSISQVEKKCLLNFLNENLERKKLTKTKEVVYDKDSGKLLSIPNLIYNTTSKKFTLKRCDKRQSTLKSLAPKKNKKKPDKIDINNS